MIFFYNSMSIIVLVLSMVNFTSLGQTLFDNRHQINLIATDSVEIPARCADQSKRDSIAMAYSNWHLRSRALERYLLNISNPGIARDQNNAIQIKLLNGETISLVPNKDAGPEKIIG